MVLSSHEGYQYYLKKPDITQWNIFTNVVEKYMFIYQNSSGKEEWQLKPVWKCILEMMSHNVTRCALCIQAIKQIGTQELTDGTECDVS